MNSSPLLRLLGTGTCLVMGAVMISMATGSARHGADQPVVPKTWDDKELATMEVPLAHPSASAKHVSADYYYRIPVRPLFKSYPVYAPGREPAGYLEKLKQLEPQEVKVDASKMKTDADWIEAGEEIFQAPILTDALPFAGIITVANARDEAWYKKAGALVTRDGVMPFTRYVIRKKGVVEMGNLACAMCHTRVMPDGTTIIGAQGNVPFDRSAAYNVRTIAAQVKDDKAVLAGGLPTSRLLFAAPWLKPDPMEAINRSLEATLSAWEAIPPGVLARHGTSLVYPVQVPDLIGVQDRQYLDRTGLVRHRGIGDLMRYAALNQGLDYLNRYGDFVPAGKDFRELPDPTKTPEEVAQRYGDEQLYALAKYVYSLKPPASPHLPKTAEEQELVKLGVRIFEAENCARCHEPPLYTNNHLTPAPGFTVPDEHLKRFSILKESVGTDSGLALQTRRGTGYYKVPSLRGVWYRGPFEHNGSVATLEEWFDPRRTEEGYVPTGWKGPPGTKTRALKGHRFGHDLGEEHRKALIAFLRTL